MKALLIAAALALPVVAAANDPQSDQTKTYNEQQKTYNEQQKSYKSGTSGSTAGSTMGSTTGTNTSEQFSDSKAVNKLHHVNAMNIDLGTLAQSRASTDKVKKFGERLVKDHQRLDTQITQYAKDKGINLDEVSMATTPPVGGKNDESASGAAAPGDMNAPGNPGGSSDTNRGGSAMGTHQPNSYGDSSPSGTGSTAANQPAESGSERAGMGQGSSSSTVSSADDKEQMKQRHQAKLDALRNLQGSEFDSQFLSDVIDGSQRAIDRLQGWKGQAVDKKLDDLINKQVNLLQTDVKDAQKLQQRTPAA
jgi:predicted outer membrane protein